MLRFGIIAAAGWGLLECRMEQHIHDKMQYTLILG